MVMSFMSQLLQNNSLIEIGAVSDSTVRVKLEEFAYVLMYDGCSL